VVDGGVYCEVDELVVVVDEPESPANDHDPETVPISSGSPIKSWKRPWLKSKLPEAQFPH